MMKTFVVSSFGRQFEKAQRSLLGTLVTFEGGCDICVNKYSKVRIIKFRRSQKCCFVRFMRNNHMTARSNARVWDNTGYRKIIQDNAVM